MNQQLLFHEHELPHSNDRTEPGVVDTIVIHGMHADEFPGCELEEGACIAQLDMKRVAAHYLIGRSGVLWRLVPEQKRAWHAGESALPKALGGRSNVNDFSIGIELVGREVEGYTEEQYRVLAALITDICSRWPVRCILGHEHVALPHGRKTDPGPLFHWADLQGLLQALGSGTADLVLPGNITPL